MSSDKERSEMADEKRRRESNLAEARVACEMDANELAILACAVQARGLPDMRPTWVWESDIEPLDDERVEHYGLHWLNERRLGITQEGFWSWLEDRINAEERFHCLAQAACAHGVSVRHVDSFPESGVLGRSRPGEIELIRGLPPALAFKVLIHEFAHEYLHHRSWGRLNRALRKFDASEFEAEAVSFEVMRRLGLEPRVWRLTPTEDALLAMLPAHDRVHQLAAHIAADVNERFHHQQVLRIEDTREDQEEEEEEEEVEELEHSR